MKPKQILTIVLIVAAGIYLSINTNSNPNQVTITGEITNPKGESVIFSNQDTSYSTTANANGTFTISFDLDSATYLNFKHGVEHTAMYVHPGDKINLTIDTKLFDDITLSILPPRISKSLSKEISPKAPAFLTTISPLNFLQL